MNKCVNQERVIVVKKLSKNLHTEQDKLQKADENRIKRSLKKAEVHLELFKISIL